MNSEPTKLDRRKEIRELEAENAALRAEVSHLCMALADTEALELGTAERCKRLQESYKMQEQQLAASQLEAKRLREAIFDMAGEEPAHSWKLAKEIEALSSSTSTDELDAYVAEKVKDTESRWQRAFDEGMRFQRKCVELTRQRDLAVSAIENLVKQKGRHNTEIAYKKLVDVLAAIKESEE